MGLYGELKLKERGSSCGDYPARPNTKTLRKKPPAVLQAFRAVSLLCAHHEDARNEKGNHIILKGVKSICVIFMCR
jgi:hypothetical protein